MEADSCEIWRLQEKVDNRVNWNCLCFVDSAKSHSLSILGEYLAKTKTLEMYGNLETKHKMCVKASLQKDANACRLRNDACARRT